MEDTRAPVGSTAIAQIQLVDRPDGSCEVKVDVPLDCLDAAFELIAALGWIA